MMEKPAIVMELPMHELHQKPSICNSKTAVTTKSQHQAEATVGNNIIVESVAAVENVPLLMPLLKPILCTLYICLGSFIFGTGTGWTSPAVYNLNSHACNSFFLSNDQISWVGSIIAFGVLIGVLVSGPSMDIFGRKTTLMVWLAPMAIGWVIIIASTSYTCLLVGRAVTGITLGIITVVCPIYVCEIAPIKIRGLLGSCHQMMICVGALLTYIFGAFLDWNALAVYCVAINAVMIVAMCFIPESPRWLVSKNRKLEAETSLKWLRGGPECDVLAEILELEASIRESVVQASLKDFAKPELWKPLLIVMGLTIAQQLTGINIVMSYIVQIFQMAGSRMDDNTQSIIVASIGVIGTLISVLISDVLGRKVLLIASGTVMTASMAGMGAFFYEQSFDPGYAIATLNWLPIVCLMLFNFGFCSAFGPIPWVVMGEVFPQRAKGLASSMCLVLSTLISFITIKCFPDLNNLIGSYGIFWFFSACCFLAVLFVVIFVPETKGKSFEEIEHGFK